MRITQIALLAIRGKEGIVQKLANSLKVSDATVYRYIKDNDDNLTKAAALEVIRKEIGLSDEEILEAEAVSA